MEKQPNNYAPALINTGIKIRQISILALLILAVLILYGCGPKNYLNDNDKLRAQNLHLTQQIKHLKKNLELQKGYVTSLKNKLHPSPTNMPDAQLPVLSNLQIGLFSGIMDRAGKPKLELRLLTEDQQGRMMPIAGEAKLTVTVTGPNGNPKVIAQKKYTPKQLDGAYRSSITGTHYLFTVPLEKNELDKVDDIVVNIIVTEANTGRKFTLKQIYPAKKPRYDKK